MTVLVNRLAHDGEVEDAETVIAAALARLDGLAVGTEMLQKTRSPSLKTAATSGTPGR
jgi:hypothetical protein